MGVWVTVGVEVRVAVGVDVRVAKHAASSSMEYPVDAPFPPVRLIVFAEGKAAKLSASAMLRSQPFTACLRVPSPPFMANAVLTPLPLRCTWNELLAVVLRVNEYGDVPSAVSLAAAPMPDTPL
jgi:hypothetical protein